MRTIPTMWPKISCLVVLSGLLFGCASGPSPLVKLREARDVLEQAKSSETADPFAVEDAEGALSYAEQEYRLSPGHPLSNVRAEKALAKARAALGTTVATGQGAQSAH